MVLMVRFFVLRIYPPRFVGFLKFLFITGWTLGWTVPIFFVDTTWPCIPCSITFIFRRRSYPPPPPPIAGI